MDTTKVITDTTSSPSLPGTPANELLIDPLTPPFQCIVSFVQDLDTLLNGGIWLGQVTEITGYSGVGKSQLVYQLLLDVQIPIDLGGCEGEAILIDTEGSFYPDRIYQMGKAVSNHLHRICSKRKDLFRHRPELESVLTTKYTPESFLSRIYVFRARDLDEQNKAIQLLPLFLQSHSRVKLICIDSIAFHYRYGTWTLQDVTLRNKQLATVANKLHTIAHQFNVAVVVTNQLTTKFLNEATGGSGNSSGGGSSREGSRLVPALGDVWAQVPATRIALHWDNRMRSKLNGQRIAYIGKNCSLSPPYFAYYTITNDGVRGLKSKSSSSSSNNNDHNNNNNPGVPSSSATATNTGGTKQLSADTMDFVK